MGTGRGVRTWARVVLVAVSVLSIDCDVPTPPEADAMANLLPEVGLLLVNRHGGGLAALEIETGRPRWSTNQGVALELAFGRHRARNPVCTPVASTKGWIVLYYRPELTLVSAQDGHELWRRKLRTHGACPVITADGGVAIVTEATAHGTVEKFDEQGKRIWGCPLPDVGRVVGELSVAPGSGDVLGRSHTHVFAVSPNGRLNWVREMAALGRGAL